MRRYGVGRVYPNGQVKWGAGGGSRAKASMRGTSAAAARRYGLTETERPLTPQATWRRPGSTGYPWFGWSSASPRQLLDGKACAGHRSAHQSEWACAYGRASLSMVLWWTVSNQDAVVTTALCSALILMFPFSSLRNSSCSPSLFVSLLVILWSPHLGGV